MVLNEISPYQFSGNGILKHELILTLENKLCIKNVPRHETNKPTLHQCDTSAVLLSLSCMMPAATQQMCPSTREH